MCNSTMKRWKMVAVFVIGAIQSSGMFAAQIMPIRSFENTMMPQPANFSTTNGQLPIAKGFSVAADHFRDDRLSTAIARFEKRLSHITGIIVRSAVPGTRATLVISVDRAGQTVQGPEESESYRLTVTTGGVHLVASTDVGAMRGLETLLQLVESDQRGYWLPFISIQDAPRFQWRGLLMDCSRHFEPVDVIERTLDGMASVKLNVFHWHLTDDQAFRMESKLFPRLTGMGSDDEYYTQAQAREIVAYARQRGIRVVPEFDMPGHTTSWAVGYPVLASGPGPSEIARSFGVLNTVMDPTRETTYRFLDKFIGEMATVFPDEYLHIGGDENNGVEWKQNPRIQLFMREHHIASKEALQAYFNQRLLQILTRHHKKMIGWDEVLTPTLPKDVVVQSWHGYEFLAEGARQGYRGILSAGYYLDEMSRAADYYEVDPVPAGENLSPEQEERILGGEICMWGEYVGPVTIDSRIWPRSAAIAERLWSPRGVNDVSDMYRRLWVESIRLEQLGLTHISQEGKSLRELAGNEEISPLLIMASTLEPVDMNTRVDWSDAHGVTSLTPLDGLVDALPPDPPFGHHFAALVKEYLANPNGHTPAQRELSTLFASWETAEPQIVTLLSRSPIAEAGQVRARQLAQLGVLGQQALAYGSAASRPPIGWKSAADAALKDAAKPSALVRFTILDSLSELFAQANRFAASGESRSEGAGRRNVRDVGR